MKISIITVTYNNVSTIEHTIQSVLSQPISGLEYIIIDGASTDGTRELIEEKYKDEIVKFVSEPDEGMYYAINKGIELATGDIIGLLHADDFYPSNDILKEVIGVFDKENCDAVYGDLQYISANNEDNVIRNWISGNYKREMLKWGWMPPHPTLFLKKEVYEKFGLFDTSFTIAADYEIMLRFLWSNKIQLHYLPLVIVKMRVGGKSNNSLKNIIRKSSDDLRAIKMHKLNGFLTLAGKNLRKLNQFIK